MSVLVPPSPTSPRGQASALPCRAACPHPEPPRRRSGGTKPGRQGLPSLLETRCSRAIHRSSGEAISTTIAGWCGRPDGARDHVVRPAGRRGRQGDVRPGVADRDGMARNGGDQEGVLRRQQHRDGYRLDRRLPRHAGGRGGLARHHAQHLQRPDLVLRGRRQQCAHQHGVDVDPSGGADRQARA